MPAGTPELLQPPLGGVHRGVGYQFKAPFYAQSASNVRGKSALGRRVRLGSRPGAANLYSAIGGGEPIRCISAFTPIPSQALGTHWEDEFVGSAFESWWTTQTNGTVGSGYVTVAVGSPLTLMRGFPVTGNAASGYTLKMGVEGDRANANTYRLLCCREDVTGAESLVYLEVQHSSGNWTLNGQVSGATTVIASGTSAAIAATNALTLSIIFNGTTGFAAVNGGTTLGSGTFATPYPRGRFGCTQISNTASTKLHYYSLDFTQVTNEQFYPQYIYETSNGKSYYRNHANAMEEMDSSFSTNYRKVSATGALLAAENSGLLYVADFSPTLVSSQGQVSASVTTGVLDDGTIADWTTYGIDTTRHVCILDGYGVFAITTVHATNGLTLASATGAAPANGTYGYRVVAGPKVFDPENRTFKHILGYMSSAGMPPAGHPCIERFMGRMVYAGSDDNPQNWYASREDNPVDFDLTDDPGDVGRAVAGNNAQIGIIGAPIVALKAYQDDFLTMAGENETYEMVGNPAGGGSILLRDPKLGIIYRTAICNGPEGTQYGLTRKGLARRSGGTAWQLLSEPRIPLELINVDVTTVEPIIAYNPLENSIHIFLSKRDESAGTNWVYDIDNDAYWPDTLATNIQPYAVGEADVSAAGGRVMLLGGQDGITRNFDPNTTTDGGVAFTSEIMIGPIMTSPAGYQGILESLQATLGVGSGSVTWSVYVGRSSEAAVTSSTVFATGTWVAGENGWSRPEAGGVAVAIKLSSTGQWAVETMFMTRFATGPQLPL